MDVEEFNLHVKNTLIRLPGCVIFIPDPTARRALVRGWRRLDGGRAVFLKKPDDTSGLAVVRSAVVNVSLFEHGWKVEPDAQENISAA